MKDVRLCDYEVYEENNRLFLSVAYSYTDDEGNKCEQHIPKIALPFFSKQLPDVITERRRYCDRGAIEEILYFIKPFDHSGLECKPVMDYRVRNSDGEEHTFPCKLSVVSFIKECATKKMTISEIEKKLGYKVEIVSEEEKK